jgi:hypothetical protein
LANFLGEEAWQLIEALDVGKQSGFRRNYLRESIQFSANWISNWLIANKDWLFVAESEISNMAIILWSYSMSVTL